MSTIFSTILTQMIGIVLLLGLGAFLRKSKLLPEGVSGSLSKLSVTVFLPALNLYSSMEQCTPENFRVYGSYIWIGGLFCLASVAVALLLGGVFAKKDRFLTAVYRYILALPNTGGVGTPLVLALYGTAGLFKYNLFLLTTSIVCYSWGVSMLMRQSDRKGVKDTLKRFLNPVFLATILGCILGLLGVKNVLPDILLQTLQKLGACYSPVVLLTTGFVIGGFQIWKMFKGSWCYALCAMRLLVIPCLFLLVARLVGLSAELCMMVLFTYACPSGMNVVIYPASYGGDTWPGAQMFVLSTLLAIVTVPALSLLL